MIRTRIARKKCEFMRREKKFRHAKNVINYLNLYKFTIRATRDKETYLITRYGLGKAEVD